MIKWCEKDVTCDGDASAAYTGTAVDQNGRVAVFSDGNLGYRMPSNSVHFL